ncbi:MAG: hypothetical protein KL785_08695 [Brevundimonas sp.]|nr:hypothetical protein [Brevundimonas sp.]
MRQLLSLLAVVLVAGCATADPPRLALGGVYLDQPLRALGTEPFWAVELRPDVLIYSGVDRPQQRAPAPRRTVLAAHAIYRGATQTGASLVVTLTPVACSDGMSDRVYPLTAHVEIGAERLSGCAASVRALMNTGESGRVVD